MFDQHKPFEVHILSGGDRKAVMRFPTDQELIERSRKAKTIKKQLGRNKSEYEPARHELYDSELFEKIRLDEEKTPVDPFDAHKFIEKLLRVETTGCERVGDTFEVDLTIGGGSKGVPVRHVLKMPTQRDLLEHGRAAVRLIDTRRTQEFTIKLEATGALWDRLLVSTEGYVNGHVPIVHKDAALGEVMSAMETLEEEDPEA